MSLQLTPEQRSILLQALLGAYIKAESFANAVYLETGIRLDDDISLNDGRRQVLTGAIQLAEGQEWLEQMVRAALRHAPLSLPLQRFAEAVGLTPLPQPILAAAGRAAPDRSLEEVIRKRRPAVLMQTFDDRLHYASRAVCWIGVQNPTESNPQLGSGFLVGPDLLITNYHVVERILRREVEPGAVVCRFDHLLSPGGTTGRSAGLAEMWCRDQASYAPADGLTDGRVPTADELDYALVQLDTEVGRASVGADGTGPARGWLSTMAEPPPLLKEDFLLVVQHPAATPDLHEGAQRIAAGLMLGFDSVFRRLRHDASTTCGSSGSPIFTIDLQLAALHHGTEPVTDSLGNRILRERTFNRGIPLRLILKRMRANGVPQFWEEQA